MTRVHAGNLLFDPTLVRHSILCRGAAACAPAVDLLDHVGAVAVAQHDLHAVRDRRVRELRGQGSTGARRGGSLRRRHL